MFCVLLNYQCNCAWLNLKETWSWGVVAQELDGNCPKKISIILYLSFVKQSLLSKSSSFSFKTLCSMKQQESRLNSFDMKSDTRLKIPLKKKRKKEYMFTSLLEHNVSARELMSLSSCSISFLSSLLSCLKFC